VLGMLSTTPWPCLPWLDRISACVTGYALMIRIHVCVIRVES
jgi:hypothetical protein